MSEFAELATIEAVEVEGCPEGWEPDAGGGVSADGEEVSRRG